MTTNTGLRPLTPNSAVWFAFGGFMFYWVLIAALPAEVVRGVFTNLSFGVSVLVAATWAPAAWQCFRRGATEGEWILVIAIFLGYCVFSFQRLVALGNFFLERPGWLDNDIILGFIPYSVTIVSFLFLIAPGVARNAPPVHYWKLLLLSVAIGGALTGFLLGRSLPAF
jgi:hypothetical protein